MTAVRRALAWSLVERYLLLVLALGSNMALARLLTPEQIGVFSVSLAVIGIAQVLRDFGAAGFLIQEKNLNEGHIRTALGVMLLLGALLFVLVFIGAPWAGAYYGQPRMATTLRISSLNFLVLPFATLSLALLRRELQFKRLLHVAIAAAVAGAAVSILLAWRGVGENSLAIGAVVTNAATALGAWWVTPGRPLVRPGFSEWRRLANFGGQTSLTGIVTSVAMDANDIIVGKVLGFQPVAILSRAQGLMNMFNRDLMSAVRNVALPAFAAAHREGAPLAVPFARSVGITAAFAWPFHGLMSLYAAEAIHLLFGAQWLAAVPLVPIFCLGGAVSAVNALTPNLLVAIGRVDLVTRGELIMQPLKLLLVAAAAVQFRSLEACAWAFTLASAIGLPVFWWFKNQGLRDDAAVTRRIALSTLAVSACALAPPLVHVLLLRNSPQLLLPLWQCVVSVAVSIACWMVAVRVFRHPIGDEPMFKKAEAAIRDLAQRGSAS